MKTLIFYPVFIILCAITVNAQEFDLEKTFNPTLSEDNRKEIKENIFNYSQMIKANPDDAIAFLNRGVAYANLGLYPDAITDYNKSIMIDSTIPQAYYNRGIAKSRFRYTKPACLDVKHAAELGLDIAKKSYNANCGLFMSELGELE
ncbi:MAG: hypothetical protein ABIJ97_06180 [Bacteroidota bacterium]